MNKTRLGRQAEGFAKFSALAVLLAAIGVLIAQSLYPGRFPGVAQPMAPVTALTFILSALALGSGIRPPSEARPQNFEAARRRFSYVLAGLAVFVSLIRLVEWGATHSGFSKESSPAFLLASMAPVSALCFLVLNGALLLSLRRRFSAAIHALVFSAAIVAWLEISRSLFGGEPLVPGAQMALSTSVLFLLLCMGILCVRSDGGLTALLVSEGLGGWVARRLVPAALLAPILLRWLRMEGQLAGWYGSQVGWSLFALANMVVFGGLVWVAARLLERADARRREAEAEVRTSRELLRAVADGTRAVIYVKDLNGCYLLVNRRFEDLFHVRLEELAGKTDYDLFSKEHADAFRAVDRQVLDSGTALEVEETVPQADGTHIYLSNKYPLRDGSGRTYALCGISTDVTERKRAEEALRESHARTQAMIETALDGIVAMDHEGRITAFNPAAEAIFGYQGEDIIGQALAEILIPPVLREAHRKALARYLATAQTSLLGRRLRMTGLRRDQSEVPLELSISRMPGAGPPTFTGFLRDITEQRDRENDQVFLLDLGAALQETTDPQAIAQLATRRVGEYLRVSRCGWMTTDQERGEFTIEYEHLQEGRNSLAGTYTLSLWGDAAFLKPLASGETLAVGDTAADPRTRPLHAETYGPRGTASMLIVPLLRGGRWVGSLGLADTQTRTWRDREVLLARSAAERIWPAFEAARAWSDERRSHRALAASEERFRRLVEADVVGIAITGPEQWLEANSYLLKILGYTAEEFAQTRLRWQDITSPEYRDATRQALQQLHSHGVAPAFESEYLRKDGSRVAVLMGSVVLNPVETTRYLSFVVDLTERKRLEEQFRQAQKLESVGRLAGGVAHDFNNLLTVITGYASLMLEDSSTASSSRHAVEQISQAAERATSLTRQLLAFSRRQPSEVKTLEINEIVRNIETMLGRLLGEDIEVSLALETGLGLVRADRTQLEQVIVNLAVNARDAMPDGGRLRIETRRVTVDAEFANSHLAVAPGHYVVLTVSDTGAGMTPEVRARIFEPFFTTKEQGKGTGLGLSTVYGIVQQMKGSIWVYSEPGRGATFKILLPEAEAVETATPPAPEEPIPGGSETVLLAEDDSGVRAYARQVLERYGYTVLESANGREALEITRQHSGPIHLLLTDMVMPVLSGADLAERFEALRPGIPILRMSGYAERWSKGEFPANDAHLEKPFTPGQLIRAVQTLLAARK